MYMQRHTKRFTCKHCEMNIVSNSSSIVNSFVSLLRYYHFSFSLVPYPQKDYIGKSVQMKLGSIRTRGRGDGGGDGAKMKTGDYRWVTQDEYLIQSFVMFSYLNP